MIVFVTETYNRIKEMLHCNESLAESCIVIGAGSAGATVDWARLASWKFYYSKLVKIHQLNQK